MNLNARDRPGGTTFFVAMVRLGMVAGRKSLPFCLEGTQPLAARDNDPESRNRSLSCECGASYHHDLLDNAHAFLFRDAGTAIVARK